MTKPPARGAEVEVFHPVWTSQPVSTDKATRETGEPEHAGNEGGGSVWWAFTAPYDGLLSVGTVNTRIDTVMGAYVGTRVNRLGLVTSNDDDLALAELEDNPGYSRITQALKKGMTLMVAADGFGDMRGELAIVSNFEATTVHELSVTSGPGGEVPSPRLPFGSDEEGLYALYAQDAAVQLLAKPGEGNEFYGWQGSISSLENPLDLVITGGTTVQATFGPRRLGRRFRERLTWPSSMAVQRLRLVCAAGRGGRWRVCPAVRRRQRSAGQFHQGSSRLLRRDRFVLITRRFRRKAGTNWCFLSTAA